MAKSAEIKTSLSAEDKTQTSIKSATDGFQKFCNTAQNSAKSLESSVNTLNSSLKNTSEASTKVNSVFSAFQGGMVASAIGSMVSSAKDSVLAFASQNDALVKTSRTVGISMESMQGLQYACDRQGISFDSLQGSLQKFSGTMGAVRKGQGALSKNLQKTNPELYEQMKNAKSNEEAFLVATDAISKLDSASERAALSTELFGKSGVELNKFFEAGADGIKDLMAEQEAFGSVSTEDANLCEEFNDVLAKLQYAFQGIKNAILSALMPGLLAIIGPLTKTSGIGRKIASIVGKLISLLMKLAPSILAGVIAFKAMQFSMVVIPKTMMKIKMMAPLVSNGFKSLKNFKGLFNGIVGGPWIALISVLIGVFVLMYTKCEAFRNLINKIAKGMKDFFMPIVLKIKNFFLGIWEAVKKFLPFLNKGKGSIEEIDAPPEPETEDLSNEQDLELDKSHKGNKSLTIDVNFHNLPPGVMVQQSRSVPGINLSLGYSGS